MEGNSTVRSRAQTMDLEIKGFIPTTMLDWRGKLASTIFLAQCNFHCPFCHNPELVNEYQKLPTIPINHVISHLLNRRGWLDGIVISGGEPTIQPGLPAFLKKIKEIGYPVKLDTNGTRPEVLAALINQRLVAAVAMDIKTTFDKYPLTVKKPVKIDKIKESIDLLMNSAIEYEFRTTVVPGYADPEDILQIAQQIKGARAYVLQQFNPKTVLAPEAALISPLTSRELLELSEKCREFVPTEVTGS